MNKILKKFHRHRYKIIGTGTNPVLETLLIDIVCKCGKHGTVVTDLKFAEKVYKQAAQNKYLRIPYILYEETE